jgi:phosphoadenosine phosphosulfate reductase
MDEKNKINKLIAQTKDWTAEQIIKFAAEEFDGKITFANSLGEEDQVILDLIAHVAPDIKVFTLDTGRLFQETYDLIEKNKKRYPVNFKIYYPETASVESMVNEKGINLFYESVDNRKLCCSIRKIEPLKRALANHEAWICGLRRAQSITRSSVNVFEWDEGNGKIKVNPLAYWSLEDVQEYIAQHGVDVNPLGKKGFISIGCSPCTRAVNQGEDIRSGRWWWESPEQKECGLHNNPKRKID